MNMSVVFFMSCHALLLDYRCLTSTNLFHTLYGLHDIHTMPNTTNTHRHRHRITLDDLLVIDFLGVDKVVELFANFCNHLICDRTLLD